MLVFYWASKSKSRVPIFFQLCLGFPWGWILKSTLVAPALKESIFEKVGQHITKFISPNAIAKTSQKVCRSDCVVWSGFCGSLFFFKLTLLIWFKKIKEFQIFFPISAKVMPWSLWKWMWPQCIFEGKHFPNSIGFSPGQAQVTNIDLKCSFFFYLGFKK